MPRVAFLGAVVVKRDISELRRWTRPHNAFVSDKRRHCPR
jgi:C4-dicarboxylate-specific signal transduction histidine kinase